MRISLFQTTTFRITVFTGLAFMLLGAVMLRVLYWSMLSVIDRQIDGALAREYVDMNAAYQEGKYKLLLRTVTDRASPHEDAIRIYSLLSPSGTLTGNLHPWPAQTPPPGQTADIHVDHAAGTARIRTMVFDDGSRLLVGRSLSERENFIRNFNESAIGVMLADMLFGIVAAMILARYARRRLAQINATADEVLEGNLSGRIEVGEGGDEYDYLARNINNMLNRIQQLVATVRGVTENIAHDLRTPLNRLRGRLEVALMAERTPEEYRAVLERAISESDTIVDTFNGILKVARIESGTLALERNLVDLTEVIEELLDLYQVFAEESGVVVHSQMSDSGRLTTKGLYVLGDGHLISQAAANLLDNAIKYSPRGGEVTITALRRTDGIGLTIADHGPGIPETKRNAILERFVRLDTVPDIQGFGLGLSFVAAVSHWHGAKLILTDNEPGLRATLLFPSGRMIGKA